MIGILKSIIAWPVAFVVAFRVYPEVEKQVRAMHGTKAAD